LSTVCNHSTCCASGAAENGLSAPNFAAYAAENSPSPLRNAGNCPAKKLPSALSMNTITRASRAPGMLPPGTIWLAIASTSAASAALSVRIVVGGASPAMA